MLPRLTKFCSFVVSPTLHKHIIPKCVSTRQVSFLQDLGLSSTEPNVGVFNGKQWAANGPQITSYNPADNTPIASIKTGLAADYEQCIRNMTLAKRKWNETPAPKRGEVVRTIAGMLREKIEPLGRLISVENGKILAEGIGEVQEAIDICDFAVGLSRSLNGQVMPSERPGHVMLECYHPLNGHLAIITAFNFPCAVGFWNTSLSLIAGNCQIWKGASSVPLVTLASNKIIVEALNSHGFVGDGIATMITGSGKELGGCFAPDMRLELVSFTGSTEIGIEVNKVVASRFGKVIMECGGNNGAIVMADADIEMCLNAVLFSAVGTAGQRCTTMRRVLIQDSIYDTFVEKLLNKYQKVVKIGNPLDPQTLCGPLITSAAVEDFENGIQKIKNSHVSKIIYGGRGRALNLNNGNFVEPTLVETEWTEPFVHEELFAPVLYLMKFSTFEEALMMHNEGSIHGLSSSLFTKSHDLIFKWLGPTGSDCGIVNVNIGTSGAEIGGAFGGEKLTGIGRESGSDSWKQYMRRSTCTINYSSGLPLAQGIKFGDD